MKNEVIEINNEIDIVVKEGKIAFKQYKALLTTAQKRADEISSIVVSEDTIKSSKKIVADLKKTVNVLEDKRKEIKKSILIPYNSFEQQVKEIVSVINGADTIVRTQIRELEEKERDDKEDEIEELFSEKVSNYSFKEFVMFKHFLKNEHLNKTVSMKKIDSELVEWLEKRKSDFEYINTVEHKEEVYNEYLKSFDVVSSINIVTQRHKEIENIETLVNENIEEDSKLYIFIIENEKDAALTELLMKENKIQYKKEIK